MIDFVFENNILKEVDEGRLIILEENPLDFIKGLALSNNTILINLSAVQWKIQNETELLNELEKTIIHENVHIILNEMNIPIESQETVCRIMAKQQEDYF